MEEATVQLGRLEELKPIYDKNDERCRLCVKENRKGIEQDQLPFPRSGHRIVMTDECLYSIGGYNPAFQRVQNTTTETNYPLFKELWRFNLANRTWTLLKTSGEMPSLLASHYAVLYRGRFLLVYGGTGVPFGNPCSAEVHCCDLQTLRWSVLECSGDVPTGTYGHTLTLVGNRLYKVGGTTGFEYNMLVYELNLTTRKWTLLSRLESVGPALGIIQPNAMGNAFWNAPTNGQHDPAPRYRHETVYYNDALYVFGGGRATVSFGFRRVAVFDLRTRAWHFSICLPDPIRASTEVQPLPQIDPDVPAPLLNQQLNPDDPDGEGVEQGADANGMLHNYVNAPGFPRARKCHAAVRCGHSVWLVGGFDNERIMNDVWCIDLRTLRWRFAAEWSAPRYFHAAAVTPSTGSLYVFGGVRHIDDQRSAAIFRAPLAIPPLERLAWQVVADRLSSNAAYILRNRLDLLPGFELVRSPAPQLLPSSSNANPGASSGSNSDAHPHPHAGMSRFRPGSGLPGAASRSTAMRASASDDSDEFRSEGSDDSADSDDEEGDADDNDQEHNYAMRSRASQRSRGVQRSARATFALLRRSTRKESGSKAQASAAASKSYMTFRHVLYGLFNRSFKTKGGAAKRSRHGARQSDEMETDSDSDSNSDVNTSQREHGGSSSESGDDQPLFRERHERIVREQHAYLESIGVPWLIADRLVDAGTPRSRTLRSAAERQTSSAPISALAGLSHTNATAY